MDPTGAEKDTAYVPPPEKASCLVELIYEQKEAL